MANYNIISCSSILKLSVKDPDFIKQKYWAFVHQHYQLNLKTPNLKKRITQYE